MRGLGQQRPVLPQVQSRPRKEVRSLCDIFKVPRALKGAPGVGIRA